MNEDKKEAINGLSSQVVEQLNWIADGVQMAARQVEVIKDFSEKK